MECPTLNMTFTKQSLYPRLRDIVEEKAEALEEPEYQDLCCEILSSKYDRETMPVKSKQYSCLP